MQNKLELTASRFTHFESVPTKHRNYLKDSWSVKIASEVRYWCNRHEISEVAAIKQATAYSGLRDTRTCMRSIGVYECIRQQCMCVRYLPCLW